MKFAHKLTSYHFFLMEVWGQKASNLELDYSYLNYHMTTSYIGGTSKCAC